MPSLSQFLIFIAIALAVFFGMNYYVFVRLVNGLSLAEPARANVRYIFICGSLLFIITEYLSHHTASTILRPFMLAGVMWLGLISIGFSVTVIADIFRLIFHAPHTRWIISLVSLIVIIGLSAYSYINVLGRPVLKNIQLRSVKLPLNIQSFKIVQLTDIHLDSLKDPDWFSDIVNTVNAQHPDLIVITGDLIDANVYELTPFLESMNSLKATYGIYAITGNHEFYIGEDMFKAACLYCGITPLRNDHVSIDSIIELAGIDDVTFTRKEGVEPAMEKALEGCDFTKPVVLLSHQPDVFDRAAAMGVDLQLSGHTHVGQIPPMDLIVEMYFKYPYGLYRQGKAYLYTSAGTGTWGPPMRLFSRSEITVIKLTQ